MENPLCSTINTNERKLSPQKCERRGGKREREIRRTLTQALILLFPLQGIRHLVGGSLQKVHVFLLHVRFLRCEARDSKPTQLGVAIHALIQGICAFVFFLVLLILLLIIFLLLILLILIFFPLWVKRSQ